MNLYQAVKQYEKLSQYECRCLENKENLETSLKQYQKGLPKLTKQAQFFSSELRKIQADKEQRRRIQSHRLENYWSQDQIAEFDHVLKIIGFPKESYLEEEIADSIKAGIVYKYKRNIYIIPNLRKKIKHTAIAVPAATGIGSGLGYIVGKNGPGLENVPMGVIIMGGLLGLSALLAGVAVILSSSKNPFEYVASELENRVEYIKTKLK